MKPTTNHREEQEKTKVLAEFVFSKETAEKIMDAHKNPVEGNTNMRWNPYEDENHGRMVIAKVMEDDDLAKKFFKEWKRVCYVDFGRGKENFHRPPLQLMMKSTLPERMDAVVSVLPEKK